MIILLQGKDTYRQNRVLKNIMAEHRGAKASFFDFEGKNDDISPMNDEVRQTSLFREKKILVTSNLLSNLGAGKEIISFLDGLSSETTVVLVENKAIPKKSSLLKLINQTYDVGPVKGSELEKWVQTEFQSRGGSIDGPALKKLIGIVGNDFWTLANEIDKIISFKGGLRASIDDVALLVKPKVEADIFKAIDAMAEKNKRSALKLIYAHLEKGDSVPYILSMIAFQFRNLNLVKNDGGSAGELGLHPFVHRKSLFQSRRFTKEELKEIYGRMVDSDAGIKTGKIEPGTALDLFIFQL